MISRAQVTFAVTLAVLAAVPTAASAAARFASPAGSSADPCTKASPCDIGTAVNSASGPADVTVESGTYGPSPAVPTLDDGGHALTIHGQAGRPRPVIVTGQSSGFVLTASSLSDVEIDATSSGAKGVTANGSNITVDRVISHAMNSNSIACFSGGGGVTLSDSLCVADGPNSQAFGMLSSGSGTLRNDTLEAPGGSGTSGGIAVDVFADADLTVTLSNVIAHGAQVDLMAGGYSSAGNASIVADHSNYATQMKGGLGSQSVTPAGSGTNQVAAPVFVNAGRDDFHEHAGSLTIDAGVNAAANGGFDLDGNPRQLGGRTDIGAYEFAPPRLVKCVVPKLKGESLAKARKLLAGAHCALGKVRKPKRGKAHKAPKHLVVKSQSAPPGTSLANGASVAVKLGPKPHKRRR